MDKPPILPPDPWNAQLFKLVAWAAAAGALLMSAAYGWLFYWKSVPSDAALAGVYLCIAFIIFPPSRQWLEKKIYKRSLSPIELLRIYFVLFSFSLIVTWLAGKRMSQDALNKENANLSNTIPKIDASILAPAKKDLFWGYIDANGKWHIPPKFENAYCFYEQRASVLVNGSYKFIKPDGKFAFDATFVDVGTFYQGIAPVATREGWGIIDTQGKVITNFTYDKIENFNDTITWAKKDNNYFILSKTGKQIAVKNISTYQPFYAQLAPARNTNHKWGILGTHGDWVCQPQFDSILAAPDGKFFPAKQANKWGFISAHGRWLISPKYTKAQPFSETLAGVCEKNATCGYIDTTDRFVIKPQFIQTFEFVDGIAYVRTAQGLQYINKQGNILLDSTLKVVPILRVPIKRNILPVIKNTSFGVVDTTGHTIIPHDLDDLKPYTRIK